MYAELKIIKVDNGYKCHDLNKSFVIEEYEDDELTAMKNLLWAIKEHFGIHFSKHNQKNIS